MAVTSPPRMDEGKMRRACREIASALLEMDGPGAAGPDPGRVRRVIFDACSRHGLPRVPTNREILSAAASGLAPEAVTRTVRAAAATAAAVAGRACCTMIPDSRPWAGCSSKNPQRRPPASPWWP